MSRLTAKAHGQAPRRQIARWDAGGFLRGEDGARLWGHDLIGRRTYVAGRCPFAAIAEEYAEPGDRACGRPGEVRSLALVDRQGQILSLETAWGWTPESGDPAAFMSEADRFAADLGLKSTPATVTGLVYPVLSRHRVPMGPLLADTSDIGTTDLLNVARVSVNQGPQVVCRASSPFATEYDLKAAYLAGMREVMPVSAGKDWREVTRFPVKTILRGTGLIVADVDVFSRAAIPPLPCRRPGVTLWPVGRFRFRGSISVLRAAVEAGETEVLEVCRAWHAPRVGTPLAAVAEELERWPKERRKPIYTRGFGLFASEGPQSCDALTLRAVPVAGDPVQAWTHDREGTAIRRGWRPDWSAEIAGSCLRAVTGAVSRLPYDRVLGGHIDSLWIEGAEPLVFSEALWKVKAQGAFRGYGVGWFDLGTKRARAGVPLGEEPPTLTKASRNTMIHRLWTADPVVDPSAVSAPQAVTEI